MTEEETREWQRKNPNFFQEEVEVYAEVLTQRCFLPI
jgi:hypothetical protein